MNHFIHVHKIYLYYIFVYIYICFCKWNVQLSEQEILVCVWTTMLHWIPLHASFFSFFFLFRGHQLLIGPICKLAFAVFLSFFLFFLKITILLSRERCIRFFLLIFYFYRRKEEEELARKRQPEQLPSSESSKRPKSEPNGEHKNSDQPQNENNQNSRNSNQINGTHTARESIRQERREPLNDVIIPPSR